MAFGARLHLAFADHVHGLNAGDERLRTVKVLETHHRPGDSLDRPVVLLDDVVEVLRLAHLDGQAAVGLDAHDGGRVGAALTSTRLSRQNRDNWSDDMIGLHCSGI